VAGGDLFDFQEGSTYIQEPPFFQGLSLEPPPVGDVQGARILAVLGDSVTTDHISPAGDIPLDSPAGRFLVSKGLEKKDFNSYGSRRGNHEVMMRGTFANIRLRNKLAPGTEGGWTTHIPGGEQMSIFDAALRYQNEGTPLLVIGGKEYGSGSSRDWAAKGTLLLGVRAVLVESYERIHRSNLIGMGVLPLQFLDGESAESLGLDGTESYDVDGVDGGRSEIVMITATDANGEQVKFDAQVRIDTPKEREYFVNGGILHYVLRQLAEADQAA
jgi:aconitate hydratase